MNAMLFLLPILVPMTTGIFVLFAKPKQCNKISCFAALATGICAALTLLSNGLFQMNITKGVSIIFRVDGLALFFLALICIAFIAALLYACEYLDGDERRPIFFGFTLMTLGAMMGLSMAGNIITFYMFFEMMSLLSFPLVLYNGGKRASQAAMVYLGFSVFGASLALMGMMLGGELTMQPFAAAQFADGLTLKQQLAFLLMALGFSCKAGMMPLANWLPIAHPVAPAPASALLSGIITKAGILGIMRTTFFLFGAQNLMGTFPQKVMLVLSIATIFAGSMLAYKEKLLKKRLAYSSVSQLSYVIFGLMLLSPAGLCGAMLQVLFHAFAKVGLFLCAGSFIHHAHVNYVDELTGMGRRMPGVMAAFTCFALSLVGIPPFGGFVAKWQLATAALAQGGALAEIGVIMLMVSALLTAGYLLPIVARGYFPGKEFEAEKKDAGWRMLLPLFVLAAMAAILGMFPKGLAAYFQTIAAGLF